MKKFLAFVIAASLVLLMTGCNKPIEKTLTITNSSEYPLDAVILSTSEKIFNTDDMIVLFDVSSDGSYMPANYSQDYTVEIPAELADAEWYLNVSAIKDNKIGVASTVEYVGKIFAEITDVAEYQNEVYGFEFVYADDTEDFDVKKLTFKSLLSDEGNSGGVLYETVPGTLSPEKPGTEASVDTSDTDSIATN